MVISIKLYIFLLLQFSNDLKLFKKLSTSRAPDILVKLAVQALLEYFVSKNLLKKIHVFNFLLLTTFW